MNRKDEKRATPLVKQFAEPWLYANLLLVVVLLSSGWMYDRANIKYLSGVTKTYETLSSVYVSGLPTVVLTICALYLILKERFRWGVICYLGCFAYAAAVSGWNRDLEYFIPWKRLIVQFLDFYLILFLHFCDLKKSAND